MPIITKEMQSGSVTILVLSGRLFIGEASDELDHKLQDFISAGQVNFLLDCSHVSGIDSQGIKSLVRGVISAQKRGGKLKLLNLSHRMKVVLQITRLLTVIESFEDEGAALQSFASAVPPAADPA